MSGGTFVDPCNPCGLQQFLAFSPLVDCKPENLNYQASFSESNWDARVFAMLALAEFAKTDWQNIEIEDVKPPEDPDYIRQEIETLISPEYMVQRRDRAQEILDQIEGQGIIDYFAQSLMLSPRQQNTLRIIEIARHAGMMVSTHFKRMFGRARPQQVCSGVTSLILGPGHPSFPSGHATESHMIALALSELLSSETHGALEALADRIGKNREIAGVHFASDTAAGKTIAGRVFPLLRDTEIFAETLAAASSEH